MKQRAERSAPAPAASPGWLQTQPALCGPCEGRGCSAHAAFAPAPVGASSSFVEYNVSQTAAEGNNFVYSNGKGIARAIKIISCFIMQAIPRMAVSCVSVSGT